MPKLRTRPVVITNNDIEQGLANQGFRAVMGLDEVGRGCLAGPVVAAGVILDPEKPIAGLADSKKLSASQREVLALEIYRSARVVVVCEASVDEIDRLNILKATMMAMHRCVESAIETPDFLLVDGNYFTPILIPHQCIIRGDALCASISAASIIAKVYRDKLMANLSADFPQYGWEHNAGYGTAKHLDGIRRHGFTPHHRKSFKVNLD
jgi:ribonuclease HII